MKGEDVVNALYKAMSENPDKKILDLFEIARKSPAPRFYVTFDKARRFVLMLDRGLELPLTFESKKRIVLVQPMLTAQCLTALVSGWS